MPFSYRLLDFGKGRKLEQFGGLLLDRPSPPAEPFPTREPVSLWNQAAGTFRRSEGLKGSWRWKTSPAPQSWELETNHFSLILKPTEVGHLGVFAEQEPNWEWIYERTKFFLAQRPAFRVLNLFAYTGGSTLAAAAAMREVGKTSADAENFSVSQIGRAHV